MRSSFLFFFSSHLILEDVDPQLTVYNRKATAPTVNTNSLSTPGTPASSTQESRPPTAEELANLPKITDRIPFSAWAVIFAGAFERFTYFGLIAPWQNYIQNPRGDHALPGALGLGQASATNISNAFFLVSFVTPMLFAVASDTRLGRYKTLMIGLGCYLTGCAVLVGTSVERALDAGAGLGGLIASMILVALGAGCVKACYVPFLGDQLRGGKERVERRGGRLVVVSPDRTLQFVYNAYYW